ncbi:trafficking protein particle complex II-specific subunit 120 homolog [Lolium rigidum]|uniref:trafficking protein particle complex II-specific subunit 120 homolog n=1 Tax=Lolium rigidum TaxID=89674 RepID=UPI001F5C4942|nr:trafficking protein particle complex II-specific subunit 120 homolog [Lolium rigidum]XP_047064661.1 trafficking protein particle complex II-specific subunit 120 homolog [Lolium rigidum]XP_051218064.1 trafficking protein particle complex II-specific subunit 120 homolog isoform X2 [Lolium perenne]
MEPGLSIESGSAIRVVVLPVGGAIPPQCLRDYAALVARHARVDLASLRPYYSEHQKSPFAHQPWDTGCLRLKFVLGGCVPSPWEDFQSSRKVLAVVGICHLPSSPDLAKVAADFLDAARTYPSALVTRCFAFCPTDAQLLEEKKDGIIMFPPSDQKSLELHMLTMIQDLSASLLMEFEKWVLRAESTGTILKTPLDSQSSLGSEEVIKAKKRRLGRAQKIIGDYCLLAGSPADANAHYTTAIDLARLTGDVFWHAGALEGSVCALVVDKMGQSDPVLEDEVKYRYYTIIQLYRRATLQDNAQRVSPVSFELEAALKLARYLCRREVAKEVSDLLMGAADGAKALIDASDRLILYIEIARLFGSLGYKRKAAFFSRQVAQLYLQQDNAYAAMSAMQVLTMTTNAYHVQSRKTSRHDHATVKEPGASNSNTDSGKAHPQCVVSLFESQWSTLQMVVLREILMSSIRAADPLTSWSAAARLLRSFYPLITPAGQSGLASSLSNSADRLPWGTRCADPCLPFIRLHSLPFHPSQREIVKRNPHKKEWWIGAGPSGPFIYTPFTKGGTSGSSKQEINWIVGEPVQVMIELANPCSFDLVVESIYLSVHSGNFDAFPVTVNLPANTSKLVLLSGIPTQVGQVSIPGCIVHSFGVITEHLFKEVDSLLLGAAQGLVLSDPFRCCGSSKFKSVNFPNITVVPPLPLLVANVVGGDGSILLYEGEIRDVLITLTNAGTVPVEEANIALSGKNQDSVISIAHSTWKSALPMKPGGEVTFKVTLRAWHLSLTDLESDGSRSPANPRRIAREGINPFLNIHYAGPSTNQGSGEVSLPPGRRLVVPLNICVVQGMRLVRARLLSMEIPARFSESHLKSASDKDNISNGSDMLHNDISLLKIDPYKGSWGLRLLELELFNPTDVVFDVDVSVQLDGTNEKQMLLPEDNTADAACHKTRIDRDYSARVLIPLEHFKLPVLDASFFIKENGSDEPMGSKAATIAEKNAKAELNASISNLISKIKVRWHSGRNSSGELNIKDAIQAALQASILDILLPDPLTFSFRLAKDGTMTGDDSGHSADENVGPSTGESVLRCKDPISAHEMTHMEVQIRNNTKEIIRMNLSISCKDVAGENCFDENSATVLWAGVLSDIQLEVPPLQEVVHPFSVYFLVPGDYSLQSSSVIIDATDVLRARAKAESPDEPILCRGSPFHIHVVGTE